FRIHLAALGLDFHPRRSPDRRGLQTLITSLTGRPPEPAPAGAEEQPAAPPGDESIRPLAGPPADVGAASLAGPPLLAAAAGRLLSLLMEIQARPPLVHEFGS